MPGDENTGSRAIKVITEKTNLPISLVIVILVSLVGLVGSAVRAQVNLELVQQTGDGLRVDLRALDAGQRDMDRRVQRLEDAFMNQQSMLKEIREDVKDLKRGSPR